MLADWLKINEGVSCLPKLKRKKLLCLLDKQRSPKEWKAQRSPDHPLKFIVDRLMFTPYYQKAANHVFSRCDKVFASKTVLHHPLDHLCLHIYVRVSLKHAGDYWQSWFGEWLLPKKNHWSTFTWLAYLNDATWGPLITTCLSEQQAFCAIKRTGKVEEGFTLTYFLHRCIQREKALSEKLIHHLLVICLYFRDHVTRNKAKPGTGFSTVESISVFITINLESWGKINQAL